jgi:predicted nucleotidyltransferase
VKGTPKKYSDIDIVVEFRDGYKTFDNYMELKLFLENILKTKIYLVLKTVIRDELKERILAEVVYV